MRSTHVRLGAAVTAAVLGIYANGALGHVDPKREKLYDRQFVNSAKQDPYGQGGFVLAGKTVGTRAAGSWVGVPLDYTTNPPADPRFGIWTTAANWAGGVIPNGPTDTATFNEIGDAFGIRPFLSSGITLQAITNNTEAGVEIISLPAAGTQTITLGTGGLAYNANKLTFEVAPSEAGFFTPGEIVDFAMTGGGVFTKNGPGDIWLTRESNYSGGTTLNGGRVTLRQAAVITINGAARPVSAAFGNGTETTLLGNVSGTLTFNGGGLQIFQDTVGGQAYVFERPIVLGPNGGDIEFDGAASPIFKGVISGTGPVRMGFTGDALLDVAMTYTGETIIDDYNFHTLEFDGSIASSGAVRVMGRLDFVNSLSFSGIPNRVGDSAPVFLYGSEIVHGGNSITDATENIGTITLRNGMNELSVRPTGDKLATLDADAIVRENRATLVIRGENLGGTNTSLARGKINLTNAPATVGGLVPWAYGLTDASSTVNDEVGVGRAVPVTYDARGLRPLDAAEMTANIAAGGNVKATASQAGVGSVNSLTVSNSTGTPAGGNIVIGAGSLTVSSGVVINNIPGNSIAADLHFGAAEGIIHAIDDADTSGGIDDGDAKPVTNSLTVSGVISGTNGLTKGGAGDLVLTGANTYTGQTTITNGRLVISADVNPGSPGPLGTDASPIVLSASGNSASGEWQSIETTLLNGTTGTVTINRNIRVVGQTPALFSAVIGGVDLDSYTKITGNIDLGSLSPNDVPGNDVTLTLDTGVIEITGVISGPGRLQDDGVDTQVILRGNNTYTGGTEVGPLRWLYTAAPITLYSIGSNQAFGTGPITVNSTLGLEALDGPRTIPNNILMQDETLIFIGNNPITLSGNIDVNLTSISAEVDASTLVTFSGSVLNGRLNKFGAGTLVLSGSNTMSAPMQIGSAGDATTPIDTGGVLVAKHPQALGYSGTVNTFTVVLPGSTLQLDATNGNINAPTEEIDGDGAGFSGLGLIHNASGNNTLGYLEIDAFLDNGTFNPSNAHINVAGSSTLTINNVWDFSGAEIAPPLTTPRTPILRGAGSATLTKDGPGMLIVDKIYNTETFAGSLPVFGGGGATGGTLTSVLSLTKKPIKALVVNQGTLQITAGGTANSTAKVVVTGALSINTAEAVAALDLTNNSMIIDYTGAVGTLVDDVRQHLFAGRLKTSTGTALTGLGYANNAVLSPVKTTFAGVNVDSTSLLIKFTYFGDTDLDGKVDVADLGTMATNWQTAQPWSGGDFDYNGTVNVNDLGLLATNWQAGVGGPLGPSLAEALASLGLPSVSVPEPTGLACAAAQDYWRCAVGGGKLPPCD